MAQGGTISVQVLNEVANVSRRKMKMSWPETRTFLRTIRELLNVESTTIGIHETGIDLAEQYDLSVCDGMIVAAALSANCDTLFSEDLQGALRIKSQSRSADGTAFKHTHTWILTCAPRSIVLAYGRHPKKIFQPAGRLAQSCRFSSLRYLRRRRALGRC